MARGDDIDYLLEGIDDAAVKQASPSTFSGPVARIWSVRKEGDATVLERPEDPFADLKDMVEQHKDNEVAIERELTEQAQGVLELQLALEEPVCAVKTAAATLAHRDAPTEPVGQATASCWAASQADPMLQANVAVECITAPVKDRMDELAALVEQQLSEREELRRMVDDKAEDTVSLIDRFRGRSAGKETTAARSKEHPHGLPQDQRDYCEDFMLDKLPTKGQEVWTPSGTGKVTDVGDRAAEVELAGGEVRVFAFNRLRLIKPKKASACDELIGMFDGERPTPAEFAAIENRDLMAARGVG